VTKHLQTLVFVLAFALASTVIASTQEKEKEKTAAPPTVADVPVNVTPLKVQVVTTRYQGEKKISSMPYTLTLSAQRPNNHATLRMGTKIPVMMVSSANVPKDAPQVGPIQYQDVGTNIDCFSTPLDGGRFLLSITVDDSSVYPDEQLPGGSKGNPSFRSFRASNTMVLKNGETGQFTTATDKVTGETVKVDVTLTVVK
jgi:type II secretory pathway component GspD/PulD (secretin)